MFMPSETTVELHIRKVGIIIPIRSIMPKPPSIKVQSPHFVSGSIGYQSRRFQMVVMEIIHSGIGRSFRINSHNLSIAVNIVIFTSRPAFLDFFIRPTVIFSKYSRTFLYILAFHTTILTLLYPRR